jgi:hypothetical protein
LEIFGWFMTLMDFYVPVADQGHYHVVHVILGATLMVYLTLGQPGGKVAFMEDDLAIILSCPFHSFQHIRWIGHVCTIGGGCFSEHIMYYFILLQVAFPWLIIVGEISYCFPFAHDVLVTTLTWLLHDGFKSYS